MPINPYSDYTPPAGSGGLFLKIDDGKEVKLRIAGDPVVFNNDFQGQVSTRYGWVVWNYDEKKAQILQQGVTGFKTIANLAQNEDWGDPTTYDIKVKREGQGTDTKYHFSPSPNGKDAPLPKEAQEAVDTVDPLQVIKGSIWVSDAAKGSKVPNAVNAELPTKPDVVHDVDQDEEIDLSDIPF